MGHADGYVHGTNNANCVVCGFTYKAINLKERWDGALVCNKDWEPEHPRDMKLKTPRTPRPAIVGGAKDDV